MLETLLNIFKGYRTCSIVNIRDKCITFVRDDSYFKYLEDVNKDIWVICKQRPKDIYVGPKVKFYLHNYPEYCFTLFQNYIYKCYPKKEPVIGQYCKIHETVVLDVDGLKVVNSPGGDKISFIHTGNTIVGNEVEIGPYTVVHRGTLDNTIIGDECKIGAHNNIGHNCIIDKGTVIAAGVVLNGNVKIGKKCWISSGVLIRHHVTICPNTIIGMGGVVVKDITKPGIYIGSPAQYLKPVPEEWNF